MAVVARAAPANSEELAGPAKARGPDTLVVRGARVRLAGVAPPADAAACERGIPCVDAASAALTELLARGPVSCTTEHRLGHGYFLGRCRTADGADPAEALLARGLLRPAAEDPPAGYAAAAAAAKAAGAGMWGG